MTEDEPLAPLVKPQRWKLWLSALAFAAIGAVQVWPAGLAILFGSTAPVLKLAGSLAGLVLLLGACLMIRCRACGLSLVWHGVSTRPADEWLKWLLDVRTCPRCGHEEHGK